MKRLMVLVCLCCSVSAFAQPLDEVVAVVNEEVITARELETHVELMKQQLNAKRVQIPDEQVLKKQVLGHLIDVDLQLQLAKQNGIRIEDKEVDVTIERIAERNHFDEQQLKVLIEKEGMTWQQYRDNLKKEITLSQIQQRAVGKDVMVTKAQVEAYLKQTEMQRRGEKAIYHLQNIVVPLPLEPTSAQLIRARKKAESIIAKLKKGADFSQMAVMESSAPFALEGGDLGERHLAELPEVFTAVVVKMSPGEISDPIRASNGFQILKLVSVSETPAHHWVQKTHVRHILLKADTAMTKMEAKAQREHLYQQLHSGASFEKLAKQYSLDPASAIKGGDLGWVAQGELVPEVEKEMESLPLHTVSHPVKSRFGWHFIEVLERKTEDDTALYERDQVRQFLQQRKFTEAVQAWQQRLRGESYIQILDKSLVG